MDVLCVIRPASIWCLCTIIASLQHTRQHTHSSHKNFMELLQLMMPYASGLPELKAYIRFLHGTLASHICFGLFVSSTWSLALYSDCVAASLW